MSAQGNHLLKDPYYRQLVKENLPEKFWYLFDEFPSSLVCAAISIEDNEEPFDPGYEARNIEVYFGDYNHHAHLRFEDGKLVRNNMHLKPELTECIKIFVDDVAAYIQVGGEVILDILGGMPLPEAMRDPSALYSS